MPRLRHCEAVNTVTSHTRATSNKSRSYHLPEEVDAVLTAAGALGEVRVLVTHDWPSGIGTSRGGAPAGDGDMRGLAEVLHPDLHLCGHMHFPVEARIGRTTVHGLNAVPRALEGKSGRRDGWWRLYGLRPDGSIACVGVAP